MNRRQFLRYIAAVSATAVCGNDSLAEKTNKLCVVLDDGGKTSDLELIAKLMHEKIPFTAAVMPYPSGKVMDALYVSNADIMLHQPMQPVDKSKTYHNEILAADTYETAYRKIAESYDSLLRSMKPKPVVGFKSQSIVGINNHQGSLASQNETIAKALVNFCKESDLILLDSSTHPNSILYKYATQQGMRKAYKRSCDFLDNPGYSPYQQLQKCVKSDRSIAIGHWKERTVMDYIAFARENSSRLVRISEL
jgi:uncharacterized protein